MVQRVILMTQHAALLAYYAMLMMYRATLHATLLAYYATLMMYGATLHATLLAYYATLMMYRATLQDALRRNNRDEADTTMGQIRLF